MPALDDIRTALAKLPPPFAGNTRFVIIGKYTLAAVRVDTHEHCEPSYISGATVVVTDEFSGWEIVDRPTRAVKGALFK